MGMAELGALPAPAGEGHRGAEAAPVSTGTTAPRSCTNITLPHRLSWKFKPVRTSGGTDRHTHSGVFQSLLPGVRGSNLTRSVHNSNDYGPFDASITGALKPQSGVWAEGAMWTGNQQPTSCCAPRQPSAVNDVCFARRKASHGGTAVCKPPPPLRLSGILGPTTPHASKN